MVKLKFKSSLSNYQINLLTNLFYLQNKVNLKKSDDIEEDKPKESRARLCYKYSSNCNLIDSYSRVLFPLAFGLFIIMYISFVTFRI